jgi:sugar phosphate permease
VAIATSRSITPAADQFANRTSRRIGLRLLPFLFLLYIANYIDRTSVAYAAIGMSRELGFSDRVFGTGAGIFFISYVALQMPGALLVELWSARKTIAKLIHLQEKQKSISRRTVSGACCNVSQREFTLSEVKLGEECLIEG